MSTFRIRWGYRSPAKMSDMPASATAHFPTTATDGSHSARSHLQFTPFSGSLTHVQSLTHLRHPSRQLFLYLLKSHIICFVLLVRPCPISPHTDVRPCVVILLAVWLWVTTFFWTSVFSSCQIHGCNLGLPQWFNLSVTFDDSMIKIVRGSMGGEKLSVAIFHYLGLAVGEIFISMEFYLPSFKNTTNVGSIRSAQLQTWLSLLLGSLCFSRNPFLLSQVRFPLQAHLGDTAGSFPDHHNQANIPIKRVLQ